MPKKIHPITFCFDSTIKEPLNKRHINFYNWLINHYLCHDDYEYHNNENLYFIPFSTTQMHNKPSEIYGIIYSEIESTFQSDIDIIIINLRGTYNLRLIVHFCNAINTLFHQYSENMKNVKLLILYSKVNIDDFSTTKKIVNDGFAIFLGDDGSFWKNKYEFKNFNSHEYSIHTSELADDPLNIINYKIIKRLGHFKHTLKNGTNFCHRFFYDGSKCIDEIVMIFSSIINEKLSKNPDFHLIFYSPFSPWLKDALITIKEAFNLELFDLSNNASIAKMKKCKTNFALFITDMIRTGETYQEKYEYLLDKFSNFTIESYTILTTRGVASDTRNLKLNIRSKSIEVKYFLHVNQSVMPSTQCELCKIGLPESDKYDENFDILSTFDFWKMSKNAGFKEKEEDIPSYRESIGFVCDYSKMIEENGSWLTYKLEKLLNRLNISLNDLVFVCPDESMPAVFSNYLRLLLSATVIKIPRKVLNRIHSSVDDITGILQEFSNEHSLWHIGLNSLISKNIIIIDEFSVSSNTFRSIHQLVSHYGHYTICFIPLVDFTPDSSNSLETPIYSLYSFQLNK
ncbi:MAG: hypothetical protein HQ557_04230 [Bacteroidetes bacterium]|nr:hypothetical protein [Bacteroidota bacterium]